MLPNTLLLQTFTLPLTLHAVNCCATHKYTLVILFVDRKWLSLEKIN